MYSENKVRNLQIAKAIRGCKFSFNGLLCRNGKKGVKERQKKEKEIQMKKEKIKGKKAEET